MTFIKLVGGAAAVSFLASSAFAAPVRPGGSLPIASAVPQKIFAPRKSRSVARKEGLTAGVVPIALLGVAAAAGLVVVVANNKSSG